MISTQIFKMHFFLLRQQKRLRRVRYTQEKSCEDFRLLVFWSKTGNRATAHLKLLYQSYRTLVARMSVNLSSRRYSQKCSRLFESIMRNGLKYQCFSASDQRHQWQSSDTAYFSSIFITKIKKNKNIILLKKRVLLPFSKV